MKKLLPIFLLIFSAKYLLAQGVCDKIGQNGTVAGSFTFSGTNVGCPPLAVQLKDNSGGTGVQYIYGYKGEDPSLFATLSPDANGSFTYLASGTYTILQYGKKGGKDMYYCATVTVQPSPTFTYNSCNRNFISLTIPSSTVNKFDYYQIDWGDGNKENTTSGLTPPITKTHNYSSYADSRLVTIKGFLNGTAAVCTFSQNADLRGGGTNFPTITKLALSDDGKQATLQLQGGSDVKYTLYERLSSDFQFGKVHATDISYPATGTAINPGATQITIPDPTKSYCFIVRSSSTGCGIPQSNELCTIPLDVSTPNSTTNHLVWGKHFSLTISDPSSDFGQAVLPNATVTIYKEQVGGTAFPIYTTGQQYDDAIDCSKTFCYQVQVNVSGESSILEAHYGKSDPLVQAVSLSPKKCIDRKTIQAPPITVGVVSVNDKNQVEATWTDNLTWQPKRKKYIFWRADSQNGTFTKIDSIAPPLAKYVDTKIDASQDASQKQYCYEITFVDECGSTSKPSQPDCSVLLTYANTLLNWTAELPFDANIDHYEVQAFDETTNLPTTESSQTLTVYSPQLDKFQNEAKYRIKAVSKTGEISYSNVFVIPITVSILFPEAFTPNGDNKNETFLPVGRLGRIKTFTLTFFNRWGNAVLVVNDIKEGWNGDLPNGEKAPEGIYAFKAEAILDDGTLLTRFGKVLLLR